MQSSLINGRYQIIKTLGQGGFGDTFLAKDMQLPSQRQCVLKALKVQATSPQMVQEIQRRFQLEAAILEGLGEHNPQIPRLYAYFEDQGKFYLVQEWIDGLTLQDIVQQRGCLSPEQVKTLLVDLLPVLQSIHDKYIIHRDVKPENIILRESDQKPVLIDFGAVKEALTTSIYPDGSSPVSVAIGTPGYMAPEQGTGRPVYSSDLYGLGFTAIYLLTGKSPQYFATDSQTGELLWQQDFPYLDTPLGQAIAKTVKFHPRDRFPTANAMLHELLNQAAQSQTPTAPPQPIVPNPPTQQTVNINQTTATKVIGSPAPNQTLQTSATAAPIAPTPSTPSPLPSKKQSGGWKVGCAFLFFSLLGLGFGLWLAFSLLGRSQVQDFPPDENIEEAITDKPIDSEPEPEPEPELEPIPEPEPEPEPEPIPEPEPEPAPQPQEPAFPIVQIGASEDDVRAAVGRPPTERRTGFWPNSIAILYKDYGPQNVSLGYIVDDQTFEVRQTEVTFPSDVNLQLIQTTAQRLMSDDSTDGIAEVIADVHSNNREERLFSTKKYKGLIKRNDSGRLYLGIWDKDFH